MSLRRPNHLTTVVDLQNGDTIYEIVSSMEADLAAHSDTRILVLAPSIGAAHEMAGLFNQLSPRLEAFAPIIGASLRRINTAGHRVIIVPSIVAEMGQAFDEFNVLYMLLCPASVASVRQLSARVMRLRSRQSRNKPPVIRLFHDTRVANIEENMVWLEQHVREFAADNVIVTSSVLPLQGTYNPVMCDNANALVLSGWRRPETKYSAVIFLRHGRGGYGTPFVGTLNSAIMHGILPVQEERPLWAEFRSQINEDERALVVFNVPLHVIAIESPNMRERSLARFAQSCMAADGFLDWQRGRHAVAALANPQETVPC